MALNRADLDPLIHYDFWFSIKIVSATNTATGTSYRIQQITKGFDNFIPVKYYGSIMNEEVSETIADDIPEVMKQQYLTVKQFGDLFGVANSSVYSMIQRGRLKTTKFGSMNLIHRREIAKFKPVMKDKIVRIVKRPKEEYED